MAAADEVRLIFLGGLAEVGKNLLVIESGDDIILIDCGIGFPEPEQPGIDLVLPDISYLRPRADRIRGIFITHGHEDHIGALPYVLPDLPVAIHATRLTAGLISVKLDEAKLLSRAEIIEFDPDEHPTLRAGVFALEPFRVSHSIPDAVGYGIQTPVGLIVITGDFKFDPTPIDNRPTDFAKLRAFGDRGVRLLVSDCVHVESPGHTPSERVVGETYDRVFAEADGRIIIATFASLIARVQQVIDTAARHQRRVVTLGRSLERNAQMALELGYLTDEDRVLITAREAAQLPDHQLVYVVTGSQGEPMAVLSRIANGDHRDIQVGPGDTVVVSATPIPGNETAVYRIINRLFHAGAEVLYPRRALVHVSGHGSQDELRHMLDLTRPRHVLPSHGEHRHMALFADLVMEAGLSRDAITFAEVGEVVRVTQEHVEIDDSVPSGDVYLDGSRAGVVADSVIRDRRHLARDGVIVVSIVIDSESGEILSGPDIIARGFTYQTEDSEVLGNLRAHLAEEIGAGNPDWAYDRWLASRRLREMTLSFLHKATRTRPTVLPVVLEMPSGRSLS